MLRATLKSLLSRKMRLVLSGLAVVLATMFVSGAFVVTDTLGRTFENLFSSAYDFTDIQVSAKPRVGNTQDNPTVPVNIEKDVVDRVQAIDGVTKATGRVFADGARAIGKNGKVVPTTGSPRFGTNWTGESAFLKLRSGTGPRSDNEIAINGFLAKNGNFKVGDEIGVLTLQPKKTFRLAGIFEYTGGRDSIGGEQTVAFTEPVAQELMLGKTGVYNTIDVKVADRGQLTKVRDAIRAALGADYTVDTGKDLAKQSSDQIKKALSYFTYVLIGFAVVALLVGIFLILNTFSIIVAQRTQELALMRSMGASRGQVLSSVLIESFVVGLVSSAIGYGVGIGLGWLGALALGGLLGGGGLEVAGVGTPLGGLVLSFALGIIVTMVAALFPALAASRIPPIAAMREAAGPPRPLTRITIAGGIITAIGVALLIWGLSGRAHGNTLWFILVGVGTSFIGVALLTPLFSRPVVPLLGMLFAFSVPGQLGRRNSARNPRRTAITAAAMMIGIALVTAISTIFSSATFSINKLVDKQLQADLVIAGQQNSQIPPTIDPKAIDQVRQLSGVDTVAADSFDFGLVDGKGQYLLTYDDLGAANRVLKMKATSGQVQSISQDEIVVDEQTAADHKWTVGSRTIIQLQRTPAREFTVTGIFARTQIGDGIVIPWVQAQTGFRSAQPVQAFVKLRPGVSATDVQKQVDDVLKDSPEVTVQTRSAYVSQSTSGFDFILGAVQVLLGIAMIIAVLGIINTLVLSVIERTRELGLLRAIGLRRSQTMRMITVESIVISLFGALLGVTVGAALGAAVVRALKDQGFTNIALPWTLMIVYLVAALIIGVVAAIIPAVRAARLNVLGAIAYE